MTELFSEIANSALGLSVKERAQLAHVIIASIHDDRSELPSACDNELKKRVQDIRRGRVKGIPAEEVFAKLEEKYH